MFGDAFILIQYVSCWNVLRSRIFFVVCPHDLSICRPFFSYLMSCFVLLTAVDSLSSSFVLLVSFIFLVVLFRSAHCC